MSHTSDIETYGTFKEFVRANRFHGTKFVEFVDKIITDCRSQTPHESRITLVHATYPEDLGVDPGLISDDETCSYVGQGTGKSDLLSLWAARLEGREDCRVITFLDNRDQVVDGVDFLSDLFVETLLDLDKTLLYSWRRRLLRLSRLAYSWIRRFILLVTVAVPVFAAVVAYFLTLLGFKAIEFIAEPKHQPMLAQISKWFQHNQTMLFIMAGIAGIVWIVYAWSMICRDKDLYDRWQELGYQFDMDEQISTEKERLANEADLILKRFATKGQTLVLIVDDVDVLDSASFQALLNLYQAASQSKKQSLLLILSYNPCNPTLTRPEKLAIRRELDPVSIQERSWETILLIPTTWSMVHTLLWGYYQHQRPSELVKALRERFSEASASPGLTLSFFQAFDLEVKDKQEMAKVETDKAIGAFDRYLRRDRRVTEDIIGVIAKHELASGCLEMLKYILAFKHLEVRLDWLTQAMSNVEQQDIEAYKKILVSDEVGLLYERRVDGYPTLVFRRPYLRAMLVSGWEHWRDQHEDYYSEVFLLLHRRTRQKERPELALESRPSKLAVDVLHRMGEYCYRYYGSLTADVGYALRYYGLETGALGKWLELWRSAGSKQEDLWNLVQ